MDENTNKDVSELTDEELDQAIESGSPSDESPETEETSEESTEEVEEQVKEAEEASVEDKVEDEPSAEEKPSPRENLRIRQVLSRLQEQPKPETPTVKGMVYREALDADDQTYQQLEQDRQAQANAAYQEGLKQSNSIQFHTRLELDAPKVESAYPQLDPKSPKFDPAVADAINSQYLYMTGYNAETGEIVNPNLRYAEYVEATMELVERAAGQKAETSTRNIAKQAASTGLRPDGSSSKRMNLNQSPDKMSDEELDAIIAQAGLSTKKRN